MTASADDHAQAATRKVEPERLELRARPAAAIRYRKGLIVGTAGGAAALVALVGWSALDPPSFKIAAGGPVNELRQQPSDVLAGAPQSYAEVPVLGPPLPGDLGRPILKHRAELADEQRGDEPAALRAEKGRRTAALASPVMVSLQRAAEPAAPSPSAAPMPDHGKSTPDKLKLAPGTIISASLITGLNSDLPGTVLAQVTEAITDSATGRTIVIPQGAKLVGGYDSKIDYGQRRAMLNWDLLVLPDGSSVALDKLPASDRAGFAGLEGSVDFHGWRLIKGVALSTALGIGTELGMGSSDNALVRALADSAQLSSARAGDEITRRNLDVKPTIRVRPGWPIRIILNEELALPAWKG